MIWVLALFVIGVALSAFFSGCETGFYRATRYRFAIDGLRGDPISRGLLWLANNPTLFVATTLIGNNLANYLTSRSVVQGTQLMLGNGRVGSDIFVPLLVTPFVFVYGELLPKNIYFRSPNRLLRQSGPFFLACGVLFAPVSATLWLMARGLQRLVGESPEIVRLRLARTELQRAIDEGHDTGILQNAQRALSHAVIEGANEQIAQFCSRPSRFPRVPCKTDFRDLIQDSHRHHSSVLLVCDETQEKTVGYVRMIDIHLAGDEWASRIRPLPNVKQTDSHLRTLMQLQYEDHALAQVVDDEDRAVGVVATDDLLQSFLGQRG